MKQPVYDVCILGGGPAGTATALALRRHNSALTVAIIERRAYDQVRIGETLPPGVRPLLAHLGIWPAFLQRHYRPAYGTYAIWGSDQPYANEFIFAPRGYGWHLDRADFDAWLAAESAASGTTIYTQARVIAWQQVQQSWRLTIQRPEGDPFSLTATFVVDATGRLAHFAQGQGARRITFDQLIGLCSFFEADSPHFDQTTLVEAAPEGWWYSAWLPSGRLVVACMCDADFAQQARLKSAEAWLRQVQRTRYTRERLQTTTSRHCPNSYPATTQRLTQVSGDGWLAVGDAAAAFDPLSSQGIFKALRSGIFAAYAISDHLAGDVQALARYERFVKDEFSAYLTTWRHYYRQEQRWPGAPFWQRRQQPRLVD